MATKYQKERKEINNKKKEDIKRNNEDVITYNEAVKE